MKRFCPRARYVGKSSRRFLVSKDPAIKQIARRVVAGVDHKYDLDPGYRHLVKSWGKEVARGIIRMGVEIRGACDVIQTNSMNNGGIGLFGGLSEDGKKFIFYEWTTPSPRLRMEITAQDARDILSGKKRFVQFLVCNAAHFKARERAKKRLFKSN